VDGNVVLEARIYGLHLIVVPFTEEAWFVGIVYRVLSLLFFFSHAKKKDYFL
jgi:hypothetical protein